VSDAAAGSIRAFIALPLPAEAKAATAVAQRELKSALRGGWLRWTPPEQIHLTLRFLGDIPAGDVPALAEALRRACAGCAPFDLHAGGLGVFPDARRPRVLWLGLGGQLDALRELQARIERETAAWGEPEDREFHAHLTLARLKNAPPAAARQVAQSLAQAKATNLAAWRADHLELMRSELSPAGARHSVLGTVALAGP
jgi:2'-5' RNA ligase